MSTRFYLPSSGAAAVTPSIQGAWDETANAGTTLEAVTTKISSAMASVTVSKANTANRALVRRYVSKPLAAATITGTIKGQIRALESATNDNLDLVSLGVYVVSNDGSTLRGTLLALGDYATALEFATSLTNRKIADGDALSSVSAQYGDRIVFEIGIKNSTSGASVSGDLSFGDNNATDLGENTTDTSAFNPWIELSQTLTFANPVTVSPGVGLLTALGFAAVVAVTANQSVSPALGQLTATGYEPTVTATSGGGGPFDPIDLSPHLWLEASLESTYADDDAVSVAHDFSGNGSDVPQATISFQPTYKTGVINGKPVFRFDSTDRLGLGAILSSLTEAEVFIVVKVSGTNPRLWEVSNAGAVSYYPFTADGGVYEEFGTSVRKATGAPSGVTLTDFNLYNISTTAGEWTSRFNGVEHYTTASNTVDFLSSGAVLGTATDARGPNGDIALFFVVPRVLTTTERNLFGGYIQTEYGITVSGATFPSAGTTVSPDAGVLTATGYAPTLSVSDNKTVAPSLGQLTATGYSPTVSVSDNKTVSAGVGSLTATGFAPSLAVSDNKSVAAGTGQLTAAGFSPTVSVSDNKIIAVGSGAVTTTGYAPTVTATDHKTVAPDTGQLSVTGFSPTVTATANQFIAPSLGQLTVTGYEPIILTGDARVVQPGTGALTLTGFIPSVSVTDNKIVAPQTGAATITGFAPTLTQSDNRIVAPVTGTLAATGYAPSIAVSNNKSVQPGTGQLLAIGYAPQVVASVSDYDALQVTLEGTPRLEVYLWAEPFLKVQLESEPRLKTSLTAKP